MGRFHLVVQSSLATLTYHIQKGACHSTDSRSTISSNEGQLTCVFTDAHQVPAPLSPPLLQQACGAPGPLFCRCWSGICEVFALLMMQVSSTWLNHQSTKELDVRAVRHPIAHSAFKSHCSEHEANSTPVGVSIFLRPSPPHADVPAESVLLYDGNNTRCLSPREML